MKPSVFVGSSREGLPIAYALQDNLQYDAVVTVWPQDIFRPAEFAIESLVRALDTDFGIFVFSPDDIVLIRDQELSSVRDNVIFELGLFIGRLGRNRAFFIVPKGSDMRIPSDLLGVNPLEFDAERPDRNLTAALGPAANKLRASFAQLEGRDPILPEFRVPYFERRALLTPTQQQILVTIEQKGACPIQSLAEAFGKSHGHMFYRLEQLRLLGFIQAANRTKADERIAQGTYCLSDSYRSAYEARKSFKPLGSEYA